MRSSNIVVRLRELAVGESQYGNNVNSPLSYKHEYSSAYREITL